MEFATLCQLASPGADDEDGAGSGCEDAEHGEPVAGLERAIGDDERRSHIGAERLSEDTAGTETDEEEGVGGASGVRRGVTTAQNPTEGDSDDRDGAEWHEPQQA